MLIQEQLPLHTAKLPITLTASNLSANSKLNLFIPTLFDYPYLTLRDLQQLPIPQEETTYLAVGGGLGSFAWVDYLRVCGVISSQITVIGLEAEPHGHYKRLCHNSQIPDHERLRSDSGSTPDNIWGWPGYAVREMWDDLLRWRWGHATQVAWQIFSEPVFAEPFTPQAGAVYASIAREANRIGWAQMHRKGRVQAIRKMDDGRYAVLYAQDEDGVDVLKLVLTRYLHLAVGYAGFRCLPDLQAYRAETKDARQVVNAYEAHDHVYTHLRVYGGTVIVRGRGIVASRLLQRLYEERLHNPNINVLHLMRSPKAAGSQYQYAHRETENHFELQPYNFPKACFGGDLRALLARLSEDERQALIGLWGGTTTANRQAWRDLVEQGLQAEWYRIHFGQVGAINRDPQGGLCVVIQSRGPLTETIHLKTDFMIDATGLDADLGKNPLLHDLDMTYGLEKNNLGRLSVSDDFEVKKMQNNEGRFYASGAMTLGGPFAPVDSFVGLQYAAHCAIKHLLSLDAPGLKPLSLGRSLHQWLRWAGGIRP